MAICIFSCLLAHFKRTHMELCTKFSLFDRIVVPILLYASAVWGIYGYNDIDIIHMKFCKLLLGVRKQTVNVAGLGTWKVSFLYSCMRTVFKVLV